MLIQPHMSAGEQTIAPILERPTTSKLEGSQPLVSLMIVVWNSWSKTKEKKLKVRFVESRMGIEFVLVNIGNQTDWSTASK
mmetsp:Transcript_18559/g.38343  ORF Transcript_18559/g.38343 Transcript_18559/m.38343 type:complete len:81 (+) Transcript_18559:2334-2576(+)